MQEKLYVHKNNAEGGKGFFAKWMTKLKKDIFYARVQKNDVQGFFFKASPPPLFLSTSFPVLSHVSPGPFVVVPLVCQRSPSLRD